MNTGVTNKNPFLGIDLLADHRSEAYFAMKDALIHYCSLRSIHYRRDFNPEVAAVLDAFTILSKKDKTALHQAFTLGYRKPDTGIDTSPLPDRHEAILNETKGARTFFSAQDLSDYESLKTAYRRCCKIHHPDVAGGTHEAMLQLNEVFRLLQEKVSAGTEPTANITVDGITINEEFVTIDTTPIADSTWCTWLGPLAWETRGVSVDRPVDADNALAILRISIAIDEYELGESTALLKRFFLKKFSRRDCGRIRDVVDASILLCTRLRAAGLDTEATEIAQLVSNSKLTTTFWWEWRGKKLNEVMQSDARPRVNPVHPRQRANWERFSQQAKTGTAARLLTTRLTRDTKFGDAISAQGGFLRLPHDPRMSQTPLYTSRHIPQPNSMESLISEQIAEYHSVFYENPTFDLASKYLNIRRNLWFSALFEPDIPLVRLLTEIKTVADFIPQVLRRTPARQRIESLVPRFTFIDFVEVLLDLPPEEGRHRLDLLAAIDARYGASFRDWLLKNLLLNMHIEGSNINFPDIRDTFYREKPDELSPGGHLTLSPVLVRSWRKEWFKAACAPIERLEHALKTGWMAPREETIARAWQRWRDYSATCDLKQTLEWETGAPNALGLKNDRLFVSIAEEAIKTCLTHILQTEFVEELYLGWWSDNLARALLRLGDTAAAHRVATRFFELPSRAQAWTTEKEMDFLRRLRKPQPQQAL